MKNLAVFLLCIISFATIVSQAFGHGFFVASTSSMTHPYGCATINIVWGHAMPMDDFLPAKRIESYGIYDPELRELKFPFNSKANNDITYENKGKENKHFPSATLQTGDSFAQKIIFKEDASEGVYQAAATLKKSYLTVWDDDKGKRHWNPKSLDQIKKTKKNIKNIQMSALFQSFAKSFITKGEWAQPKAIGHALELIPLTDLTKVQAGDIVSFQILFNGEPYQPKSIPAAKILAYGELYGCQGNYQYGIWGNIHDGKGNLRMPAPGKWAVQVFVKKPISEYDGSENVSGKALEIAYIATATFNVNKVRLQ